MTDELEAEKKEMKTLRLSMSKEQDQGKSERLLLIKENERLKKEVKKLQDDQQQKDKKLKAAEVDISNFIFYGSFIALYAATNRDIELKDGGEGTEREEGRC